MINVTDRAKQELQRLLIASVDWPNARLRLIKREQGQLGLGIDIEEQGDQILEYEGTKVLLVCTELATSLKQVTLDVDDTPEGAKLVIWEKSQSHLS
jgi:hypothetical protein